MSTMRWVARVAQRIVLAGIRSTTQTPRATVYGHGAAIQTAVSSTPTLASAAALPSWSFSTAMLRAARRVPAAPLVAGGWFVVAFLVMLWTWDGSAPRYFPSPDEAVNRMAAQQIVDTGHPLLNEGVNDPEDLRHPRHWISLEHGAIPVYPPAAYVLQSTLQRLPVLGPAAVMVLAAAGIASFAAAIAILGRRRPAIALLAPLVAFPATYWLLRPWTNMAVFLSFLSFALLCWALWTRERRIRWLLASAILSGAAATVRPDVAGVLMLAGLALTLAVAQGRQIWIGIAAWFGGGAIAVSGLLALNWFTTGDPLQAGYEILDARATETSRRGLPFPLGELEYVLLPNGLPDPLLVLAQAYRYWFTLGPIAILSIAAIVSVMMCVREQDLRWKLFASVAVLAIAWYAAARVVDGGFGAGSEAPELRHSLVRYWSPIYLLVGVLPLVATMRSRRTLFWAPAVSALVVLAALGARELYSQQPESITHIRSMQGRGADQAVKFEMFVPSDALVYTSNLDKLLWAHFDIATLPIDDPVRAASSINRALEQGRDVYVIQPLEPPIHYALAHELSGDGWEMASLSGLGVYRVATPDEISRTVFNTPLAVRWLAVEPPPSSIPIASSFTVDVSVQNQGLETWVVDGDTPVHASYHWLRGSCDQAGSNVLFDGLRTRLPNPVPPSEIVGALRMRVEAPKTAGTFCLMLDLVQEHVSWFRSRGSNVPMYTVSVRRAGAQASQ